MMKMRSSAIMLSLVVLLAATAAMAEQAAIRLPSEGHEAESVSDADVGGKKRPWKCCDRAGCTKSIPPICRCGDTVKKCAAACKKCVKTTSGYVCKDTYTGWPGPTCTKPKPEPSWEGDDAAVDGVVQVMAPEMEEKERPWKCCTSTVCTKSLPPICRCLDKVSKCHRACKECIQVCMGPDRYTCQDIYRGDPGPKC